MKLRLLAVLIACALSAFLTLLGTSAGSAAAATAPCFDQVAPLPGVIPPWGFHTGDPLAGSSGSYARAYGDIDLAANTISGRICQVDFRQGVEEEIVMAPQSPIIFHTHTAQLWGYPGNEIRTQVRVIASTDPACGVHSVGVMTMYASYNGVRSDSIAFHFSAGCRGHNALYHGPQVNAQVPPL